MVTVAGCLGVPFKMEDSPFVIHSVSFEVTPDFVTSFYFRLTTAAPAPTESWEYSLSFRFLDAERQTVGARIGDLGGREKEPMRPPIGKEITRADLSTDINGDPSRFHFSITAQARGAGWNGAHWFDSQCFSIPERAHIPNCGVGGAPKSEFGGHEYPQPDEPLFRDFLARCCEWKHRPVDVYSIGCDIPGNLSPERLECSFAVGNLEKTDTTAAARIDIFTNTTTGSAPERIGTITTQSTHPLKHREAERLDVSLNVPPDAVPTLSKTFLVRVTAFPDGNEDAAAIEERWVTWMALNETDERQPPDAASDRGSSTRP